MRPIDLLSPTADVAPPARTRNRVELPDKFKWNLDDIFTNWDDWSAAFSRLEQGIERYAALKGTLSQGPERLLEAFRLSEELGQLAYRVWYFPSLRYDEDQRDNAVNAKRQQVQILFAQLEEARSWFNPELLRIPLETVRQWMKESEPLRLYGFAIEDLYRQQEHVLDEAGERLMSLSSRLSSAPNEAYWALSTADAKFPTITLSTGESVQVTYGQYRRLLATCRDQSDRRATYEALYDTYGASLNTYAALYNGVMQREWFEARARGYASTLDAALFGNDIPTSVVENLIKETKAGVSPFRRYHALRKRVLGLEQYEMLHERGSSHGLTRIIRLAYHEDPSYVPLLRRSYELWHELETTPRRFRVLTGERTTGALHVGHYFGSLKSRVTLQDWGVEMFLILADYQAITDRTSTDTIKTSVREIILDYLATGIDPKKSTIFCHSMVPSLGNRKSGGITPMICRISPEMK